MTAKCKKCGSTERGAPRKSSYLGDCLQCTRIRANKWASKNSERIAIKNAILHKKNRDKVIARAALRKKNNPEIVSAEIRMSILRRKNRVPAWLTEDDKWMIKEIYQFANLRSKVTGIKWHVDHIIPLQGRKVSGLHVPINLQVIPAKENVMKSNKFYMD